MERIKLNLPEQFLFSTNIAVRITDINYGGHVGNDSFLSLIHEARQQFLNYYQYSEMNFAGTSLIMADVAVEYKKELSYGDVVKISVTAIGFDKLGFDIFYLLELFHLLGYCWQHVKRLLKRHQFYQQVYLFLALSLMYLE